MSDEKKQESQQARSQRIEGSSPGSRGASESKERQGYKFKLRSEREREFPIQPKYIALTIVIILIILGTVAVINSTVFQSPDSMNYNDYVGVWQEDASKNVQEEGGVKLRIHSVSGGTLLISLEYYGGNMSHDNIVIDDVGAVTRDGEAYYAFSDDGQGNSGNGVLTFKGRKIQWKSVLNNEKEAYYDVQRVKDTDPAPKEPATAKETTKPTEEFSKASEEDDDYILPNSADEYLTMEDLEGLSPKELRLARNEIMARHGRKFGDPELSAYFESKDWYEGTIDGETFDAEHTGELNEYELRNVDLILSMEQGQ